VEDAEDEPETELPPHPEPESEEPDEPLEEGDRIWATGLFPQVEFIQATTTISQRLAEGF